MDFYKPGSRVAALTLSGAVIALYVALMYFTQSFAFGPFQIRVATALYALAYPFPFLVLPLGAANFLSNLLGGLGPWDLIGGAAAGLLTSGAIALVRKLSLPKWLIIPAIIFGPGLLVPLWLSPLTGIPYGALAVSLCAGQTPPAVLGFGLVCALARIGKKKNPAALPDARADNKENAA